MATTTSTETAESGSEKVMSVADSFLRGMGIPGLAGIVWLHTSILVVLMNEVLGDVLTGLAGFVFATALGIPVVASVFVMIVYFHDLARNREREWSELVIRAVAIAWIVTPIVTYVSS